MKIEIKKTSTLEQNVSLRTIMFKVLVDSTFITEFEDYEEAQEFKENLEKGDISVDWTKVFKAN